MQLDQVIWRHQSNFAPNLVG